MKDLKIYFMKLLLRKIDFSWIILKIIAHNIIRLILFLKQCRRKTRTAANSRRKLQAPFGGPTTLSDTSLDQKLKLKICHHANLKAKFFTLKTPKSLSGRARNLYTTAICS